jgi:hypothetical protein
VDNSISDCARNREEAVFVLFLFCVHFFLHGEGPRSRCYGRTTALRLFVQPYDEDEQFFYQVLQVMEHQWNEIDRGKPTTRRKTCPSAILSTTNPTWIDAGSNPGVRSGRPATNRLSHGTALCMPWEKLSWSIKRVRRIVFEVSNIRTVIIWPNLSRVCDCLEHCVSGIV